MKAVTLLVAVLAVSPLAILHVQAITYVRSLGYWSTHNLYATVPALHEPWPIPEEAPLCDLTYLQIITEPTQGCAWRILAQQWIVAMLNAVSGASVPDDVMEALWIAQNLLYECTIPEADRDLAISLAELLTAYNEGLLGVPAYPD
jgi:hypothetical protein